MGGMGKARLLKEEQETDFLKKIRKFCSFSEDKKQAFVFSRKL